MYALEISSLPTVRFAHVYRAPKYSNHFRTAANFIEVSYIADGALDVITENGTCRLHKGDVLCLTHLTPTDVRADVYHCHHTTGADVELSILPDGADGLFLPPVTRAEEGTAEICRNIDAFIHSQAVFPTRGVRAASAFLDILCDIDKRARRSGSAQLSGEVLYVRRAKEYIQSGIQSAIRQSEIAERLGITPGYLCGIFKKSEGMTLTEYVNRIKLEGVRSLMERENVRLYEAAALYGYSDPNYVSRLFKKTYGYNITDAPRIHPQI